MSTQTARSSAGRPRDGSSRILAGVSRHFRAVPRMADESRDRKTFPPNSRAFSTGGSDCAQFFSQERKSEKQIAEQRSHDTMKTRCNSRRCIKKKCYNINVTQPWSLGKFYAHSMSLSDRVELLLEKRNVTLKCENHFNA